MIEKLPIVVILLLGLDIQAWESWQPVFLEGTLEDEYRLAKLVRENDWDGVLSPSLALVAFHDFSRFELVAVSEIGRRLHPTDPRLDPFLKSVPRLFESSHQGIWIYVHQTRWSQGFGDWLGQMGFKWHLPGALLEETTAAQLPLAIVMYTLFLFMIGLGVRRILRPWLMVLWGLGVFYLLLGGDSGLLSLYAASLFVVYVLDLVRRWLEKTHREGREDRGRGFSLPWLLVMIPLVGVISLFTADLPTLLIRLLKFGALSGALTILIFLIKAYWDRQLQKLEHRLFLPLELKFKVPSLREMTRLILALGTVLPALLLSTTDRFVLTPPWNLEQRPTQNSARELLQLEIDENIPGPRLFLAHLIFQESFPYGMVFGQIKEEPLYQPFYRREGNKILEDRTLVLPFDSSWKDRAASRGGTLGLQTLIGLGDTTYLLRNAKEVRLITSPSSIPGFSFLGLAVLTLLYLRPFFVRRERSIIEGQQRRQAA